MLIVGTAASFRTDVVVLALGAVIGRLSSSETLWRTLKQMGNILRSTSRDGPEPQLRSDAPRGTERRILRAAARLLAADRSATTQQIADAAEVGRQTVYRRYPTREALVEAIVAEAMSEFLRVPRSGQRLSTSGAQAVARLHH